jgi:hypothetical protein
MRHDRCQTMQATWARGQRALQHVVDEIVRILENAAAAGPGEEG